jgi:metallothiol transferase
MIIIESLNYIALTVSSLDNSIEFYKDLFDFEVIHKYSDAGKAIIRMGDILIELNEVEGYKVAENSLSSIGFYVDEEDFEDALNEIEEIEIEIVYGPENIRNGQAVIFLDPDGNRIELSYPKIS